MIEKKPSLPTPPISSITPEAVRQENIRRLKIRERWKKDPGLIGAYREYYRRYPISFINDQVTTMDPRNASKGLPNVLPLTLFPRQEQMIRFIHDTRAERTEGVIDKARGVGASWCCVAYSVWSLLFERDLQIGWGSLKQEKLSSRSQSSIFGMIGTVLRYLPKELTPPNLDQIQQAVTNPDQGTAIIGQTGEDLGRGDRFSLFFVDEFAHFTHPEVTEASLAETCEAKVFISTTRAGAFLYQNKVRNARPYTHGQPMAKDRTNLFTFDWQDNPLMTPERYHDMKTRYERDGLLHLFKQEYDRDATGSLTDALILREWVEAATDLHHRFPELATGSYMAALDVADEGGDMSALSIRRGLTLIHLEDWSADTGETTRRAVSILKSFVPATVARGLRQPTLELQYDSVGVGAGVKGEANRLAEDNLLPQNLVFVPWNAGAAVLNPDDPVIEGDRDSPTNSDHYANLKAQATWSLRNRFERTFRVVAHGEEFPPDQLTSISSEIPSEMRLRLIDELTQLRRRPTANLKEGILKKPDGSRSPDLADTVIQNYFPAEAESKYLRAMRDSSLWR